MKWGWFAIRTKGSGKSGPSKNLVWGATQKGIADKKKKDGGKGKRKTKIGKQKKSRTKKNL